MVGDEELSTDTVYEGSRQCLVCGNFMTPIEALYTGGKECPTCRNLRAGKHMKGAMSIGKR